MSAADPERIVIPTDGSAAAMEAVREGLALATRFHVPVTVVHAIDPTAWSAVPGELPVDVLVDTLRREGDAALTAAEEAGRDAGVTVETQLLEGHPHEAIVGVARDSDLIVMGTTGHRGLTRLLLGSVTSRVVRLAPCPVLVVPARAGAESASTE